jgi:uncharacterized oligopeptide transporter (OPT) family protein
MITGQTMSWGTLVIWTFTVCMVGVVVSIGLRRQLIEEENLPFPSGFATGKTLQEIYGKGSDAVPGSAAQARRNCAELACTAALRSVALAGMAPNSTNAMQVEIEVEDWARRVEPGCAGVAQGSGRQIDDAAER